MERGGGRLGDRAVVAALLVACAVPMLGLAWVRLRFHVPSGDEPHYLVISEALARYHSLDVQRVYDHGDYRAFHPLPIEPHTAPGPDGPLPLHGIGGPVLWLVPYLVAGRAGVLAFMVGVSLLIVANVYGLSRALGADSRTAAAVGLAVGVGSPVLTYSSLSFVEPIGALVCVHALRVLHAPRPRTRDLLLVSAGLGALCWVHGRFLLFPPLFLALLLIRLRRDEGWTRRCAWLLGPAVVLFLGLELYHLLTWHTLDVAPNQTNAGAVPFRTDPAPALAGVLFDQEVGVVPNFPVFLLMLPGILLAGVRDRLTVHVALAVVPYTLVVCSFPAWFGAWSPPARFMAVVLPLLAGHLAVALQRARHVVVTALAAAAVLHAGVLTAVAASTPDGGFSAQSGRSPALAALGVLTGADPARWVPSATVGGPPALVAAWATVAIGLAGAVWLVGRRRSAAPSSEAVVLATDGRP